MLDDSDEMGSGFLDINLPGVGQGEAYWTAYAVLTSSGSTGWHLDGQVTIENTTREFSNLMMDDRMTEETINLLVRQDRETQSSIVSAIAEHTGLSIELIS